MGKVLILYDSASGNTAKMAELVAAGAVGIQGIEVRMRRIEEASADDVLWCDGLAVGSPTNMGLLSWKMKRFWDEPMAPWRVVDPGGQLDVTLTPRFDKHSQLAGRKRGSETHQVFGTWAGRVRTDDDLELEFDALQGFAEEARQDW